MAKEATSRGSAASPSPSMDTANINTYFFTVALLSIDPFIYIIK